MSDREPEHEPELGRYKTTVEVREASGSDGATIYKATWRGLVGSGHTIHDALQELSTNIEEQG